MRSHRGTSSIKDSKSVDEIIEADMMMNVISTTTLLDPESSVNVMCETFHKEYIHDLAIQL